MKQSKLLKKLLTASERSFIIIDRDLNITDTSFGAERFSEYPHEPLIDKDIRHAFPETVGLEATFNSIWTHQATSFEIKGICRTSNTPPAKRPVYFDFYIIGTNEVEDAEQSIIICIEDVTEIMVMSQELLQRVNESELLANALLKSKEYIDKVVLAMADALIVTDHQGIIKTINPATTNLFGYTESELINSPISILFKDSNHINLLHQKSLDPTKLLSPNHQLDLSDDINDDPVDALSDDFDPSASQDDDFKNFKNIEIPCLSKSQDEILVSFSCSEILDWQIDHSLGANHYYVYVGRNITEMRQKEQEILMARKVAEESAQAKSIFLANMSHEIRTPLNGVLGMTELLLGTSLDSYQKDFVENISLSGNLLLSLINRILDLSKLEQGALELESHPFHLDECIEEVLEICAFQAHQNQVELVACFEEDLPMQLMADTVRFKQILMNLVGNAIKFTRDGEVLVKVERDRSADFEQDPTPSVHLKISVIDTGLGIDPEDQSKLFKPFSQVDSSTTRLFGGTGLGLTICRQLAELMGGRVSVISPVKDGKGTCFSLNLVFAIDPAVQPQALPQVAIAQSGDRPVSPQITHPQAQQVVLVVDPNLAIHQAIKYHLTKVGMSILGAINIEAAIAYLENQKIDLVLIDEQFTKDSANLVSQCHPDPDDVRATIHSVSTETTDPVKIRNIPILVMIKSSHQKEVAQILDQGFQGYVTKPINGLKLIKTLTSALTIDPLSPIHPEHINTLGLPNLRILLAEDNIVNQKVTLAYLSQLHCNADLAENGEQVLEKYRQIDYDVILMDCQMPIMDGYETTQAIRQLEAEMASHSPVPRRAVIIAMTANAFTEDRDRCLAVGMDDYLSKPIRRKNLKETLEYWMSKFPKFS